MQVHIRKHTDEKPYDCDICHSKFRTASSRTIHRRLHFEENPYICELCGEGFKKSKLLIRHKQKHDPSSKVQCKFCEKTFIKADLRKHEVTHIKERPFKCEICGRGYLVETGLRDHMKICNENNVGPKISKKPIEIVRKQDK